MIDIYPLHHYRHHAFDVVLEEDSHIYRDQNGARNLSVIRKIVLAALEKNRDQEKEIEEDEKAPGCLRPCF